MSLASADAGAVLVELVVELDELVTVKPGTVVGTTTNTGAALQLAIVSDAQLLANKLLMRPNSL